MIGSVGETEFRAGDNGPELVKTAKVGVIDDGPQKPSSIHRHVGQRPIVAAGNTGKHQRHLRDRTAHQRTAPCAASLCGLTSPRT